MTMQVQGPPQPAFPLYIQNLMFLKSDGPVILYPSPGLQYIDIRLNRSAATSRRPLSPAIVCLTA